MCVGLVEYCVPYSLTALWLIRSVLWKVDRFWRHKNQNKSCVYTWYARSNTFHCNIGLAYISIANCCMRLCVCVSMSRGWQQLYNNQSIIHIRFFSHTYTIIWSFACTGPIVYKPNHKNYMLHIRTHILPLWKRCEKSYFSMCHEHMWDEYLSHLSFCPTTARVPMLTESHEHILYVYIPKLYTHIIHFDLNNKS